jgi:hypothetical protein
VKTYEHSIICGHHYPEAKVVKRLSDYLELVEYPAGQYLLVTQEGHLPDDAIISFQHKPWPDPDPEGEQDPQPAIADEWMEQAEAVEPLLTMPAGTGYFLWRECLALGFLSDDNAKVLHYWLFDYIGKLVEQYEASGKVPTQPTT